MIRAYTVGTGIGLIVAATLYLTVPAYAAFINWQFQNPLTWIVGLAIGIGIGVITD